MYMCDYLDKAGVPVRNLATQKVWGTLNKPSQRMYITNMIKHTNLSKTAYSQHKEQEIRPQPKAFRF